MSKFDTNGGYFAPKDYLRVNEGGSHEENPNGGVQIGVDPEGNPNLLEEGEPVYKDYVYSDNITAEKEFLEQNNLPGKYEGKLYSKIADDFVTEAEERPLDPISRNGLEAMLGRLAEAQEGQKQAKEQRDLEDELAQLSPEELEQLDAMLAQSEQEQMVPEQMPMEVAPEEQMVEPVEPMPVEGMPTMGCGGRINKYPLGGIKLPYYGLLSSFPTTIGKADLNPPVFTIPEGKIGSGNFISNTILDPAYVFAKGPTAPSFQSYITNRTNNDGLRGASVISDETDEAKTLGPAYVYATGPSGYNFPNQVTNTRPDGLKLSPHPIFDLNVSSAGDEDVVSSEVSEGAGSSSLLPTWPRYAGAIGSGLLGLYNVFQQPDRYTAPHINPQLPEGRINLQNQVYNPVDQNMIMNAQIAQGNATNRALRNSGLGPSSAAAILAADNNTTGNLGTGFLQTWDANNQRRNVVTAANNQAEAQRAQFDYTVDAARKDAINRLAPYNAQNDLMVQRLNNQAEAEKYQAISNQISNGLQALSGIGQENFAMNQINTNPAFLGYGVGVNGGMYYNPRTGRYERIEPMSQPATTEVTTTVQPQAPLLRHYPRDYQLELLQNPTLYPGYDMTLNGLKKKNR